MRIKKTSEGGVSSRALSGMLPEDEEHRAAKGLVKKKKLRREKHVPVEVEDTAYKVGQETKKKKKRPVTEDAPVAKKKKTRDPNAVASSKSLEKVAQNKQQVMKAVEQYAAIPESTDEYDMQARLMFENLISLASRLEEQMEERIYNKDVYALNVLYSQIRELIADLRASRDISAQIHEMQSAVVTPYHRSAGQAVMNILFQMSHSISEHVKDADRREELLRKLKNSCHDEAARLQGEYLKMPEKIQQVLS